MTLYGYVCSSLQALLFVHCSLQLEHEVYTCNCAANSTSITCNAHLNVACCEQGIMARSCILYTYVRYSRYNSIPYRCRNASRTVQRKVHHSSANRGMHTTDSRAIEELQRPGTGRNKVSWLLRKQVDAIESRHLNMIPLY